MNPADHMLYMAFPDTAPYLYRYGVKDFFLRYARKQDWGKRLQCDTLVHVDNFGLWSHPLGSPSKPHADDLSDSHGGAFSNGRLYITISRPDSTGLCQNRLRVYDAATGMRLDETPAKPGQKKAFGWEGLCVQDNVILMTSSIPDQVPVNQGAVAGQVLRFEYHPPLVSLG